MPSSRPTPDPHLLLLHDAFLRRVARGLVTQGADADDLVQATYARALAADVRAEKPVHAWLRVIAQRLAWRRGTRESTRRAREARARSARSVPAPADVLEREELRHRVVRAVLALPERDREVLILRYLEDRSLRDVAATLGLPVETVRTRQKRALARLRSTLDREQPGTLGALAAILPRTSSAVSLSLLGGVLVKKTLVVGALLLVIAGAIWLNLCDEADPARPGGDDGPVGEAQLVGRPTDGTQTPPGEIANAVEASSETSEHVFVVRDRVTGLVVAGAFARVPTRTGLATFQADEQSRIRLQVKADSALLIEIGAAGYVSARVDIQPVPATDGETRKIALIPFAQLSDWRILTGQVVNERGHPVAGALVWTADMSWWTYETLHTSTSTDAEGRFEIVNPTSGGNDGHILRAHHPTEGDGMDSVRYPDSPMPGFGRGPIDKRRRVELQRNIRIVLKPARGLPLAIEGPAAARAVTYELEIRPAESRFATTLALPRTRAVRHGEAVSLGIGTWALLLRAASGNHLCAAPLHVEVDAGGVHRTVPKPTPGWDDATWTKGEALAALPFVIADRRVRIRVLADGAPVAGTRIRIESSRHADPYLVKYSERDASGGILGSGILADYQPGRREIDALTRVGRTEQDGVAAIRGWLPEPALVWVQGSHVVDHFQVIEAWPNAPSVTEMNVVLGGSLDIRLPAWLGRGISLRDLQTNALIYARQRDLPLVLPPGRYAPRVRQWSRDGRTSSDRPLTTPVVVRAGATHSVDLSDTPPPLVMALRLRPVHAQGDVCIRQRGRFPPQDIVFEEGIGRWEMVTYGRSQLVIAWAERSGVQHEHRVMLQGIGRADEDTSEIDFDLDYKPGSVELEIDNRGDRPMALVFGGSDLDAPYDYGHTARVALPARTTTRATVHDLPAGTYKLYVGDEEHTADRARIDVVAGQTVMLRSAIQRQVLRLVVAPADAKRPIEELEGGWVWLRGPAEDPRADGHLRSFGACVRKAGVCLFEKLPPGTYEATASWPGDRWHRGMHSGLHTVPLGTIRVERGENEAALRVPTRAE